MSLKNKKNAVVNLIYPQIPLWFDAPSLDELKTKNRMSELVAHLRDGNDFVESLVETTKKGEEYLADVYKTTFKLPNKNGKMEDVFLIVKFYMIGDVFKISIGYDINKYIFDNPNSSIKIEYITKETETARKAIVANDTSEKEDKALRFRIYDAKTNKYLSEDVEYFLSIPEYELHLPNGSIMKRGEYFLQPCTGYKDLNGTLIYSGDYLNTDEDDWKAYVVSPDSCLIDKFGGFSVMPNWSECEIIGKDKNIKNLKKNSDNFIIRAKFINNGEVIKDFKLSSKGDKVIIDNKVYSLNDVKIELLTGYKSASNLPIMEGDILTDKLGRYTVCREKSNFYLKDANDKYVSFPDWESHEIL